MKPIVWPYSWPHISRRRTWRIADGPLIESGARGRTTHRNRYSAKWSSSSRNVYAVSLKNYGCSDHKKTVRMTANGIDFQGISALTAGVQDTMPANADSDDAIMAP